jgi:hypothetical protein
LNACDANHVTTRSTPVVQVKKNLPKPVIKKKEKEKEGSFMMFLNPFIKI